MTGSTLPALHTQLICVKLRFPPLCAQAAGALGPVGDDAMLHLAQLGTLLINVGLPLGHLYYRLKRLPSPRKKKELFLIFKKIPVSSLLFCSIKCTSYSVPDPHLRNKL